MQVKSYGNYLTILDMVNGKHSDIKLKTIVKNLHDKDIFINEHCDVSNNEIVGKIKSNYPESYKNILEYKKLESNAKK